MQELIVTDKEAGQRLDHFLGKYLSKAPKSFFYKMLRKKNIVLNGKKAEGRERLQSGDAVRLFLSDQTIAGFRGTEQQGKERPAAGAEVMVVYEDEEVLVLNKPAGVLSQKASREDVSLMEWIRWHMSEELAGQNVFQPGICNRLDRNTTGLVVAGKTVLALQAFNRLFRERELRKLYLCLAEGKLLKEQKLEGYLTKSERTNQVVISQRETEHSVWIETEYRPLEHFFWKEEEYTLLEVHLITGKSHQIRAHLSSIGHPVVGDGKYGRKAPKGKLVKEFGIRYQLLHAWKLNLGSPDYLPEKYRGMEWTAPLPASFERVLRALRDDAGERRQEEMLWHHGIPED